MSDVKLKPFLKWAGGKTRLLSFIKSNIPSKYNRYIDPFVGAGSLMFELSPDRAVINDINRSLINVYEQIRDNPKDFLMIYGTLCNSKWDDKESYYYYVRDLYNRKLISGRYDVAMASLMVYLNRSCFNGLYRVDSRGLFNVGYGGIVRSNNSRYFSEDYIYSMSEYLKSVEIHSGDFYNMIDYVKGGDFVFIDSPYLPLESKYGDIDSFVKYSKDGFDYASHLRVVDFYDKLNAKGCYVMATNHSSDLLYELYGNKGYRILEVDVRRSLNISNKARKVAKEVVICNYL